VTFDAHPDTGEAMINGDATTRARRSVDDAKFTELYLRYGRPVQAYCARRIDRSQVADAVAETFLVAWRRLDEIHDVDAALPWLYGTAYRVIANQRRTRARARNLVQRLKTVSIPDVWGPDTIVARKREGDVVMLAVSRLKAIDREILLLEIWEGLSHADVAIALATTPQAVRQRAYRARRNVVREYDKLTGTPTTLAAEQGGD
jgi:RNA polymerase sigma-70 factor (ECF subfamily)